MSIDFTNPAKRYRGVSKIADWASRATAPGSPSRRKSKLSLKGPSVNGKRRSKGTFASMPGFKRFKRRGARSSVKRRRVGGTSSALGLKMAGVRFRRSGRAGGKRFRFRRGLKSKKPFPLWFKTIMKGIPPTDINGNYGNQITLLKNTTGACTHWKHLSIMDYQFALDDMASVAGSTSATAAQNNAQKIFITDVLRRHTWRNAATGGETTLQFYVLKPRRDLPATISGSTFPVISPPASAVFGTGGTLNNVSLFGLPISDEFKAAGASNTVLSGVPHALYTPYMSEAITTNFVIKPLKVVGPNGKSSKIRLQPGQECYYEGKYRGPKMVSWNKLGGTTQGGGSTVGQIWECRRETPIIFCVHQGSVVHDTGSVTSIGTSPVFLDYLQMFSFKVWRPMQVQKKSAMVTTNALLYAGNPEQVDIVTAAESVVTNS